MIMNLAQIIILGTTVTVLAGCGGGGDSGVAVSGATTFALQAGYQARIKIGAIDNYTVSGTCAGTAATTSDAAITGTFEGVTGLSVPQTVTANTSCAQGTIRKTITSYFDANYGPLGSLTPNGTYEKFLTAPQSLPALVKVGDAAVIVNLTRYANSTKATIVGHSVISYVIETDTANTAIVNVISKSYNAASQLLLTVQDRYRIAADGALTSTTIDMQYSTTSTTYLLLTKS